MAVLGVCVSVWVCFRNGALQSVARSEPYDGGAGELGHSKLETNKLCKTREAWSSAAKLELL